MSVHQRSTGLSIRDLTLQVRAIDPVPAVVSGISLSIRPGEIAGLIGESGSGKTLTALAVVGLLPGQIKRTSGTIELNGQTLSGLAERELRRVRGRSIGMIFQEPLTALNPRLTIRAQFQQILASHTIDSAARGSGISDGLAAVGLRNIPEILSAYPHQLSGGMRQRVLIAATFLLGPELVIADEPTSALDSENSKRVLDLIIQMAAIRGVSVLLISHDVQEVRRACRHVHVMHEGRIIESGLTSSVFEFPQEEYTKRLIEASVLSPQAVAVA